MLFCNQSLCCTSILPSSSLSTMVDDDLSLSLSLWLSLWLGVCIHKPAAVLRWKVSVCRIRQVDEAGRQVLSLLFIILRCENPFHMQYCSRAIQETTAGCSECWSNYLDWLSSLCWPSRTQRRLPKVFPACFEGIHSLTVESLSTDKLPLYCWRMLLSIMLLKLWKSCIS